jgi:hypothetical protein
MSPEMTDIAANGSCATQIGVKLLTLLVCKKEDFMQALSGISLFLIKIWRKP